MFETTHAPAPASLQVDVVHADGVVRDDAELWAGRVEELVVDAVGEHQHQPVAAGDAAQHLLALERPLGVVQVELERALELLAHPRREAARGEDPHGVQSFSVGATWTPETMRPTVRFRPGSGPNGGPPILAARSDRTGMSACPPAGTQTFVSATVRTVGASDPDVVPMR